MTYRLAIYFAALCSVVVFLGCGGTRRSSSDSDSGVAFDAGLSDGAPVDSAVMIDSSVVSDAGG